MFVLRDVRVIRWTARLKREWIEPLAFAEIRPRSQELLLSETFGGTKLQIIQQPSADAHTFNMRECPDPLCRGRRASIIHRSEIRTRLNQNQPESFSRTLSESRVAAVYSEPHLTADGTGSALRGAPLFSGLKSQTLTASDEMNSSVWLWFQPPWISCVLSEFMSSTSMWGVVTAVYRWNWISTHDSAQIHWFIHAFVAPLELYTHRMASVFTCSEPWL